jgi:hypothetical protein
MVSNSLRGAKLVRIRTFSLLLLYTTISSRRPSNSSATRALRPTNRRTDDTRARLSSNIRKRLWCVSYRAKTVAAIPDRNALPRCDIGLACPPGSTRICSWVGSHRYPHSEGLSPQKQHLRWVAPCLDEREEQSGVLTARSDRHWRLCLHGWRRDLAGGGWTSVEAKPGVGSR